jgi:pyruvate formate lyase activating enzyme
MKISGVIENSLSDWPGRLSFVVFSPGCNFRCPFCHNPSLVEDREERLDPADVLRKLHAQNGWVGGVVLSGGEPTLQDGLEDWIGEVKAMGFPIKLDTNGSRPEVLERLLAQRVVDFAAMDIKAAPETGRYARACGDVPALSAVRRSMKMLKDAGIEMEYRTTVVPGLLEASEVPAIARWLGPEACWVIQQFRPGRCLNETYNGLSPFPDQELEMMRASAAGLVARCRIRGGAGSGEKRWAT